MRKDTMSSFRTKTLNLKTFAIAQQSNSRKLVLVYEPLFFQLFFFFQRCSSNIKAENLTQISEFHLLGFSEDPDMQPVLFGLFLFMYLLTVLGNLLIILVVSSDSHLHTPMYFFLSNLSLADICSVSTTIPKMIVDIVTHSRVISYVGCLTQMSLFIIFICMDDMLLTVMAYDRFVAICHPLQYPVIMNTRHCGVLVLLSFLFSLLDSQLHNLTVLQFTYLKDVLISNFFCNPAQLLNLDSSENFFSNILKYIIAVLFGLFPISGIFLSYYKIIYSILRIPSPGGKFKAFSTCGTHLSVVGLFYGTSIGVYFGSSVSQSPTSCLVASVIYTLVTPMLNPFIYSLKNRDIKISLSRLHCRKL
ncbi:putative gustatory receptor clone PTE01 [Fukomys damarensis]|uniref:putative gustatory receptor clone PTE01 n=1 Tax=Fukomys damarensis TaxID=885580 RepID=UPI0008FEDCDD|nr:putative gustatory receptor clone PTE01 [Fukomys damarensis]